MHQKSFSLISVIIPLYNKEKYIAETIQSVIDQTFDQFEILVINDGSTDKSLDCVEQITDDRLHILTIPNSGVSVARNEGIRHAKNDWIAFLDADDYWAPTFLEEMIMALDTFPNHKIFTSGRSRVFKGAVERYSHSLLPHENSTGPVNYYEVIAQYLPPINSSNVLIEKALLLKTGGFKDGQKKYEDHDLWLRISVGHEIVMVNKNLAFYRKIDNQTASSQPYSSFDFLMYIKTIKNVKAGITEKELPFFRKYYERFLVQSYLKYRVNYTSEEKREVLSEINSILKTKAKLKLSLLKLLPVNEIYAIYKIVKR